MRRTREDIDQFADLNVGKARVPHDRQVLLDEECAGNSAGPEVNLGPRLLRHRQLHHYIGQL
jgi:hypothetical protein